MKRAGKESGIIRQEEEEEQQQQQQQQHLTQQGKNKKQKKDATDKNNKKNKKNKNNKKADPVKTEPAAAVTAKRHDMPPNQQELNKSTLDELQKLPFHFPPTIYTDVEYTNGICFPATCMSDRTKQAQQVPANKNKKNNNKNKKNNNEKYMNAFYAQTEKNAHAYSPLLSNADLWSHKYAAQDAAKHGPTMTVFRLLGTMTRILTAEKPPRFQQSQLPSTDIKSTAVVSKRTKITKAAAKKQARLELSDINDDEALDARTVNIQNAWNDCWTPDSVPAQWHHQHGHILPSMVNDGWYVPLHVLIGETSKFNWTCSNDSIQETINPYPGLPSLPAVKIDTPTVLQHLATLQSPTDLYAIPLILTYPRLIPIMDGSVKTNDYQLEMGVYAHRLLPEVLLERHLLQTIMAALDEGTYLIKEPLHMPPVPLTPTFASADYPQLVYHDDEDDDDEEDDDDQHDHGDVDDVDDDDIDDDHGVIDLTLEGTTRASGDTLSAYTIPGLLKLWENTGTDTSAWSTQLQPLLQQHLSMPLLLHQQHAVCWMLQMEHLDGFGINSILWEERSWWDGNSYYYSPALGQLRLDRPATMHGGILADEMGLGKTIMILALIVATLEEMKATAENNESARHTTLIIVPSALLGQWRTEITKAAPQLRVQIYNAQTRRYDINDDTVDICLATYPALEHASRSNSNANHQSLQDCSWGRIVLDEMQEVRSPTTQIAKACCDRLQGNRRWMLSGTPLFDGIDDLRGELNFLSLEPYAAKSEDGFFDFSITDHWQQRSRHGLETLQVLGLLLLRRSKTMTICDTGAPLMGLKPLTVEFVPISQTPAERALYCFLEYIVAHQLKHDAATAVTKKGASDHRMCLRLLRELCLSPVLLSGGLGVMSELTRLNHLVVQYNRHSVRNLGLEREEQDQITKHDRSHYSCTEAIRYLSQVQARVQTAEDFVSDLQLGAGGGMAKRNRATDSVGEKMKDCREALTKATEVVQKAQSMRAKAHWHWALEKITTGAAVPREEGVSTTVKSSIAALWRWRAVVLKSNKDTDKDLPTLLLRGWRPSARFTEHDILTAHPEFAWAHPVALVLQNVPDGVTVKDLNRLLAQTLQHNKCKIFCNGSRATLQLHHADDAKILVHESKKGISVSTSKETPLMKARREECEAAYRQAKSENDVFPCPDTRKRVKESKRALEEAARGLMVVLEHNDSSPHILLSRAKSPPRSMYPQTAKFLFSNLNNILDEANETLAVNVVTVDQQSKLLKNLERAADIPDEVKQMSAFESLESMQLHEYEKTFCCICMGVLGSSDPRCTDELKPGLVGLTPCGHLFCTKCIHDCIRSAIASRREPQCPSCRKDLTKNALVHIDPSLSSNLEKKEAKERSNAKSVIQKAAKMLEDSNGQLDPEMWLQLFLAIDLPTNVSQRGEYRVSAIPKEVISFFRAATGFDQVLNKATALPNLEPAHGLSSKMQALMRDLPRNERSVVFTTSRTAIKHLMALFEYHNIAHREVFSGQNPVEAQTAVQEWKSSVTYEEENDEKKKDSPQSVVDLTDDNPLILIVQAGAAASGLTLTAACKMFFLEPFVRQEEEQQAYARCHRYGQVHPVHAKVYFTPVSVESRLLEWRKQEASTVTMRVSDTKLVYTDIMEVGDSDDDEGDEDLEKEKDDEAMEAEDEEDSDQTRFLLGLE